MQPYSSRVGPVYLVVLSTGLCYVTCVDVHLCPFGLGRGSASEPWPSEGEQQRGGRQQAPEPPPPTPFSWPPPPGLHIVSPEQLFASASNSSPPIITWGSRVPAIGDLMESLMQVKRDRGIGAME